ncbi:MULTISPECIES: LysE family translocator [Amycolatopsis]|uniref:LysE family translocator n=1 Tax=Amycolatopsis TaxID=1813 RepID=UPI000B8AE3DF|nr:MULTISPECIES: LysE family translocator [Amycolatopsis]OXM67520.1 lysine transporter LysE [Amycolatopsis sp. KNN50.9b]
MTMTQLVALAGVIVLGAMAPGPDFVIVSRNALVSGRRAGMACAAGITAGVFCWAIVTALGLAGLLAASAVAFTVVKLAGAAYLLFLGIRALLAARRGRYTAPEPAAEAGSAFRQGLVCNLLNPKVAAFFLALLPQFVPGGAGPGDHLLLAVVASGVTLAWFLVLANVVGALRRVLSAARVRRGIDAAMGTLLVGLGVRIALP